MYETAQQMFDALSVPFPTMFIKWRVGSTSGNRGLPLCYVDSRAVMDRLDSVCGMDGWQRSYTPSPTMLICNLGIRLPDASWVWKSDGAGPTDFEGEKGMASDAFKRAAVNFGVGRYLYDLKCEWVEVEVSADGKRKTLFKETIKSLNEFHDEKIEEWGWDVSYRPGAYAFRLLGKTIKEFVTDAASAQDFKTKNAGIIAQLPVRMRQRLTEELDSVGAPSTEAAE
jgi:hypothetical protein